MDGLQRQLGHSHKTCGVDVEHNIYQSPHYVMKRDYHAKAASTI
jgi:hypothetical protein